MEKRINVWLENPLFSLITEQNNPQIKLFRVMINSKRFIFSDLCFVQFVNCILYFISLLFFMIKYLIPPLAHSINQ